MGHPKKQKRKYAKPFRPWDKTRLEKEKKLLNEYGLRKKKELWQAEAVLRSFRRRARDLLGSPDAVKEKNLKDKLVKMGISCTTLDEVLSVSIDNILSRRLQTIVYKKGVTGSVLHARQMIVHGHVRIEARKVKYPGYMVTVAEEATIETKVPEVAPVAASE